MLIEIVEKNKRYERKRLKINKMENIDLFQMYSFILGQFLFRLRPFFLLHNSVFDQLIHFDQVLKFFWKHFPFRKLLCIFFWELLKLWSCFIFLPARCNLFNCCRHWTTAEKSPANEKRLWHDSLPSFCVLFLSKLRQEKEICSK